MDGRINNRDGKGWMIPRAGTDSRKIYLMLRKGVSPTQIAKELGVTRNHVNQVVHRIRRSNTNRYNHYFGNIWTGDDGWKD